MKKSSSKSIKSAFVLGSSSQVAQSLCIELAKQGCQKFHLVARNLDKNDTLIKILTEDYQATVDQEKINLLDNSCLENASLPVVKTYDLYLITAGILGNASLAKTDIKEAFIISETNYNGLIPWLTAIATKERINQAGRLWVFSSVASDRGRPSNYHYGAAKAALTTFCEGLFLRCQNKPFSIRIIKAGFMDTPMSIGKAPKLLCAKTSTIAKNLMKNPNRRGIEYSPRWWSVIMLIVKYLPAPFASKL